MPVAGTIPPARGSESQRTWLLVDPTDALMSYAVTDAAAITTHVTPPPNDPAFAGFCAWFQAADLQGADLTQIRLSRGLATAL